MVDRHARWVCALTAALVLSAARVGAQTSPPANEARAAYEQGVASLEAQRFQEAALSLERSYALRPVPIALYNLALAYRGLGRYRDAIGLFDRYLQSPGEGADPERIAAIRVERDDLLRALVHLSISVRPAGATLSVDGRAPITAPDTLELDPGVHVLEWSAPLHRTRRDTITATPGSSPPIEVALDPVREGRLQVDASGASVLIDVDGARAGVGRVERELPIGEHTVALRAEGYVPVQRTVTVTPGSTVRLMITMVRRGLPGWVLPTVIAGSVVVVGAVIAGVVIATREDVPALRDGTWGTIHE
ncbi:MAG: PEGA domain-containing protein [Polyangiales bacterium]